MFQKSKIVGWKIDYFFMKKNFFGWIYKITRKESVSHDTHNLFSQFENEFVKLLRTGNLKSKVKFWK